MKYRLVETYSAPLCRLYLVQIWISEDTGYLTVKSYDIYSLALAYIAGLRKTKELLTVSDEIAPVILLQGEL